MKNKTVPIFILIIVNILLYIVTLGLWIALPDHMTLNVSASVASFVLTSILLYPYKENVRSLITSSYTKKLFSSLITISLLFFILSLLNYLIYKHNVQFDLTQEKLYTLSDSSIKVVSRLDKPITIKIFSGSNGRRSVLELLELYKQHKSDIEFELIDPELKPHIASEYNIKKYGTIVVEDGTKRLNVTEVNELTITNAFIKMGQNRDIKLYYTTGHDEIDFSRTDREGGSELASIVRDAAYELVPLDLAKQKEVPSDANAVLILGPREGFLDSELDAIDKYLKKTCRLFILLSPEFKKPKLNSLREIIKKTGLFIHNDVVVDRLSTVHGADPSVIIVSKYNTDHKATKKFEGRTIFPLSSSISLVNDNIKNSTVSSLIETSPFPASWAESDLKSVLSGKVLFDEKDFKGPISIFSTLESKVQKIAAVGTSSFLINGYISQGPNFNLFMNVLSWLVDEDVLISLNRPTINRTQIFISGTQYNIIFYFTIILIPLIFISLAVYLYRRKRKL